MNGKANFWTKKKSKQLGIQYNKKKISIKQFNELVQKTLKVVKSIYPSQDHPNYEHRGKYVHKPESGSYWGSGQSVGIEEPCSAEIPQIV